MKIARFIYEWPPPWLGLAPAPYEMTKAQIKKGHTVEIFCGRWPNAGDLVTLPGLKFHTYWRAPLQGTVSLTTSLIMFFDYLKFRQTNKIDMIHAHGHFALWIYLYRNFLKKHFPWAKELDVPLVAHFHNTVKGRKEKLKENGTEIKFISEYLDWPLAELSDRTAVKVADALVFVSQDLMLDAIKYYGADPAKCFVIESGVNPEAFKSTGSEEVAKTRIELQLESRDKIILNIGAMVERKNIHLLVESLKFLPKNYKLMLIGEGDEEYLDRIDATIKNNDLINRVLRVGYTPYPQLPIAYQSANLFVLPSSFEGLPKVVIESLACGTPVLAAGFKLQNEIVGLEYLKELTPEAIAKQIEENIQNPKMVDVYKIVSNYSWDVKANEMDKVYEQAEQNFLK